MKRLLALLFILGLALPALADDFVDGEVLVRFHETASDAQRKQALDGLGLAQLGILRELGVEPVDDTAAFRDAHLVFVMNNNRRYRTLDVETRAALMARPGVIYDAWGVIHRKLEVPEGVKLHVLGA